MIFLLLPIKKKKVIFKNHVSGRVAAPHVRLLLWTTLQTISVWISRKRAWGCFDIQKAMSAISQATWCREIALNSLNPLKLRGLRMPQSILELRR